MTRPLLHRVNQARARAKLKPLRYSRSLNLTARAFGYYLSSRPLAHAPTIHVDRRWAWAGECLARGQITVEQTVDDWLASPPHRAILLSRKARRLGAYHHRGSATWVAHLGGLG